jgi:hypothetical protein
MPGRDAEQPDGPGTTVEIRAPAANTATTRTGIDEATTTTDVDTQLLEQLEADYAAAELSPTDPTVQVGTANDTAEMDTAILDSAVTDEAVVAALKEQVALKRSRTTVLDYNLVDLDSKAPHVHLPSELNDRQVFAERRTSVVDALRVAIQRDPLRRDLCMKLLETYHSMASANRRAFGEFVRTQASGPNSLSAEDWQAIIRMGRDLAGDDGVLAHKEDLDRAHFA